MEKNTASMWTKNANQEPYNQVVSYGDGREDAPQSGGSDGKQLSHIWILTQREGIDRGLGGARGDRRPETWAETEPRRARRNKEEKSQNQIRLVLVWQGLSSPLPARRPATGTDDLLTHEGR